MNVIFRIKTLLASAVLFWPGGGTMAQKELPEVEIFSQGKGNLVPGLQTKPDSARYSFFQNGTLADWLTRESFLNIRSYGPGMVASLSAGGGNASQFQVVWNGIPLNHLMLGQTDANIIPFSFVEDAVIQNGQNSLSFGSGNMGGQIQLHSIPSLTDSSLSVRTGWMMNTLKNHSAFAKILHKKAGLSVQWQEGLNMFTYSPGTPPAFLPFQSPSIQTYIRFHNRHHELTLCGISYRQIRFPGNFIRHQFDSSRKQTDLWYLPSLNHSFKKNNLFIDNIFYYMFSGLDYLYQNASVFSRNNIHRTGTIHHVRIALKNILLHTKAETHKAWIISNNYRQLRYFDYLNLSQTIRLPLKKTSHFFESGGRGDYFIQSRKFPFTYYIGFNGQGFKKIHYWIKYSTSFRHPTANELYWVPGGNPELRPETSAGAEAGQKFSFTLHRWNIENSAEIFHRITNNWILWTPGTQGNPTPLNIQKVRSRGIVSRSLIQFRSQKFFFSLQSITSYILSTIVSNNSDEDFSLSGRQLIYTPRYRFNHSLYISYSNISFCIWHHYTGYRFTASDNSQWLNPFHIWDASLSVRLKRNRFHSQVNLSVWNICNTSYENIRGYPMPGRVYQIQLLLNINYKKIHL